MELKMHKPQLIKGENLNFYLFHTPIWFAKQKQITILHWNILHIAQYKQFHSF